MTWHVGLGSGRAMCKVCGLKIPKEEQQVTFRGNKVYECVHLNCLIHFEKIQVLRSLEDGN